MLVVFTTTAVSNPVVALIVNIEVLLLSHVPPDGVPVIVTVDPAHKPVGLTRGDGRGLIVTTLVVLQVLALWYVMIAVPAETPVTIPKLVTVAILMLLLVHVPLALVRVVPLPAHATPAPDIGAGNGFTVTVVVLVQPSGAVYVIVAVPSSTPLTMPDDVPTVAIDSFEELHTPLDGVVDNKVVEPIHTTRVPPITAGVVFTVTRLVAKQPFGTLYDIVVVPALDAVTMPLVGFTVALDVTLLDHVPPGVEFVNVVVVPVHIDELPTLGDNAAFTVTILVLAQPNPLV